MTWPILALPPAMNIGDVHLWRAATAAMLPLAGRSLPLQELLSPDELDRASRFKFLRDAARFTAARGSLRVLLGGYLGIRPEAVEFDYNPWGKPRLKCEAALDFNVSHSGDYALYAFARFTSIGVDVEQTRPELQPLELARTVFSPGELARLTALPPEGRHRLFYEIWAAKEAVLKAAGLGLSQEPGTIDLQADEAVTRFVTNANTEGGVRTVFVARMLEVAPGYVAALALPAANAAAGLHAFTFEQPR